MSELPHSDDLADQIERAFAYRGYVTVARRDGTSQIGFVYDPTAEHVEMFDELARAASASPIADIADIALTGEDIAAKAQRIWERRHTTIDTPGASRRGDVEHHRPALILVALPIELRAIARASAPRDPVHTACACAVTGISGR